MRGGTTSCRTPGSNVRPLVRVALPPEASQAGHSFRIQDVHRYLRNNRRKLSWRVQIAAGNAPFVQ